MFYVKCNELKKLFALKKIHNSCKSVYVRENQLILVRQKTYNKYLNCLNYLFC